MKVCLYIRLSSADRDLGHKSESDSIVNQRALLHQYLKDHKDFYPYETIEFVDDGYSGTNGDRPSFERMITFLRDGGAKLVLCKDLSRFFRDYVEIGDYLERIFPFLGVRFIAVNDGYDSDDYKGTTAGMDVVMKCIVYGFYSKDLSQKVKTVLRAKQKKGQFVGSYAPYGYLKDPEDKHHLVPDPVAAPIIRRIFDMALSGKTTGDIAKVLNADHVEPPAAHFRRLYPNSKKFQKTTSKSNSWTCMNVYLMLKRQEYTGSVVAQKKKYKSIDNPQVTVNDEKDWIIVPNCHEAIVTTEEYEKAQEAIIHAGKYDRGTNTYLLRSLVRCGVCGRIMSRSRKGAHTGIFYKCDKNRYIEDSPCPIGERFYEAELEKLVLSSLSQLLQVVVDEYKRMQEAAAKTKGTVENMRSSILRIEQSIKKNATARMDAYEKYKDGILTREQLMKLRGQIKEENQILETEKKSLSEQLTALETAKSSELHETASAANDFLKAENVTNQMLMTFIDHIKVYSGMRIEIAYRFSNPFMEMLDGLQSKENEL